MDAMPPPGAPTWSFLEWAISGLALAISAIFAWAGNQHFTVRRLDRDVDEIKAKMETVATRDDVARVESGVRQLLDWALGTRPPSR
jgi:hypothetical protein